MHEVSMWSKCLEWLLQEIDNYLQHKPTFKIKILDIGYGYGTILEKIYQKHQNLSLTGIDIQDKLQKTELQNYNINFYKFNFEKEDPFEIIKEKFHIIILTETLEHFNFSPVDNFKKIHNLLDESGKLFLSTPNQSSWNITNKYYRNFDQLLDTKYNPCFSYTDDHFWHYSETELQLVAARTNFNVEKLENTMNLNNLQHINCIMRKT